jgi:fructosamine-3-kinase
MLARPDADGLHHVVLADGRCAVVKRRRDAPPGMFAADARGLVALAKARGLRVPEVFAVDEHQIVLEDLGDGARTADFWERAGFGLATQHQLGGARFGFDQDGFCGDSPQDNTRDADGWRFFAERRLVPQARKACDRGLIQARDLAAVDLLCDTLRERVPAMPPVLLHGDLWSGNLHVCGDGTPALIDAGAVHYGWAEADLAMLILFGSPPGAFFDAYADRGPLHRDWRVRAPFYNLYHLLNHINLFGRAYLAPFRAALASCA